MFLIIFLCKKLYFYSLFKGGQRAHSNFFSNFWFSFLVNSFFQHDLESQSYHFFLNDKFDKSDQGVKKKLKTFFKVCRPYFFKIFIFFLLKKFSKFNIFVFCVILRLSPSFKNSYLRNQNEQKYFGVLQNLDTLVTFHLTPCSVLWNYPFWRKVHLSVQSTDVVTDSDPPIGGP